MTLIWLICLVFNEDDVVIQKWWPPEGWALTLYVCAYIDVLNLIKGFL